MQPARLEPLVPLVQLVLKVLKEIPEPLVLREQLAHRVRRAIPVIPALKAPQVLLVAVAVVQAMCIRQSHVIAWSIPLVKPCGCYRPVPCSAVCRGARLAV